MNEGLSGVLGSWVIPAGHLERSKQPGMGGCQGSVKHSHQGYLET